MSTLQVTTIKSNASATPLVFQDSAGTEVMQGCTAWVNFNGTGTVAIRDSFNVSSITDNGVGKYSVNFATAMANSNYCATISLTRTSTYDEQPQLLNFLAASCDVENRSVGGSLADSSTVTMLIAGGK